MTGPVRQVLLDTSVVIAPPTAGLASIADLVAVSAISVAELEYGVGATDDLVERQRRRRRLRVIVEEIDVLPFDERVAESYGLLANLVRAAGHGPRPRRLDLLIGATAERHGSASRHATSRTSDTCNAYSTSSRCGEHHPIIVGAQRIRRPDPVDPLPANTFLARVCWRNAVTGPYGRLS